jgi:short-subunit dehydrogenase
VLRASRREDASITFLGEVGMETPKQRRTVLLTGASHGIGPHIARALAAEGMNLVLTARSESELVAADLRARGAAAAVVAADLTTQASIEHVATAAEAAFGGVDVLVNNAGGDPIREFDQMTWDENERILALNLVAPLALTRRLLPGMLARRRAHVVNISAIAGRVGFPYTEVYAAAKDGLIGFTRVLRTDYRERGVSASTVVLGAIRGSGQGQRMADEAGVKLASSFTAPAEHVANAVVRAIGKDLPEIVVMPGPGRLVKALMDLFPNLGPAMNRMAGTNATLRKVMAARQGATPGPTPPPVSTT